jgi:hypothetical protein
MGLAERPAATFAPAKSRGAKMDDPEPHTCSIAGWLECCVRFRTARRAELRRAGETETVIQAAIVRALRARGVWVIRTGVSTKRGGGSAQAGEGGMPDLCLPRFGWLEVKKGKGRRDAGRLSMAQQNWHAKARAQGVRVAVVSTVADALAIVAAWEKEAA